MWNDLPLDIGSCTSFITFSMVYSPNYMPTNQPYI